ncbi:MAG: hypothetical protein H6Q73_563 [Firmicutes bacterium]|nr:hypothetical protein [Bacillota bacterium]
MSNIKEKVSYLQGLTKGLNVTDQSTEGKLMLNVVDVLHNMAEEIHYLETTQEDMETYMETIDEDLSDLEDVVYEEAEDMEVVEVECPDCHETVAFESSLLNDDDIIEVTCPNCGEVVYENTLDYAEDNYGDMNDVNTNLRRSMHPGV